MQTQKLDLEGRKQRGLLIAQRCKIKKTENGWRVPSQTRRTYYVVTYGRIDNKLTCTCPDHKERLCKCKHIWAVEFVIHSVTDESGNTIVTKSVKVTYPQNWRAYDMAQTKEKGMFLELLNDLCKGVANPTYKFGRPKMPLGDMVFASALKVYSTFSLRRFTSDMQTAKEKGYLDKVPHYSTVALYMENPDVTPVLMELIKASSLPLKEVEKDFAVDSSGFSTSQFGRWFDYRYGKDQVKRLWVKCHLMCGVRTNTITAVSMTHGFSGDSKEFPELVKTTAENFEIREVSGDKAYLSTNNLMAVKELGGTAYIPFKSNSSGRTHKSKIWKKMLHLFLYKQEEFMAHYHKRSNVETAFFMIKSKFGSHIRSKKDVAQINEVLLKVLCHNICVLIQEIHELGIEPDFMLKKCEVC